jgi:hypothetical protein
MAFGLVFNDARGHDWLDGVSTLPQVHFEVTVVPATNRSVGRGQSGVRGRETAADAGRAAGWR